MIFWLTTQLKSEILPKVMLMNVVLIVTSVMMAMPVFADIESVPNHITVYDNREKNLKITEISLSYDFTSMSVLVENIHANISFRIEHELNPEDTFNEHIEITATDGMGNVSETVNIKNPFYISEITETVPESELESIQGSLTVTGSNEVEKEIKPVLLDNESLSENSGFNTTGWASVVDNSVSGNKEFFIVRSETGNEFYIVIDRENGKDNVYFLNAVTEWDLLGLTEKYEVPNNLNPNISNDIIDGSPNNSTIPVEPQENNENKNAQSEAEVNNATITMPETPKKGSSSIFGTILLILFAGAASAYFYFFKFKRKHHKTSNEEFLPDDYGDESEDEDESENDSIVEDEDEENNDDEHDTDDYDKKESTTDVTQSNETTSPVNLGKSMNGTNNAVDSADNIASSSDDIDDGINFTDEDIGDIDYDEEIDEDEILGSLGGFEDEEEDNTV